MDHAGVRNQMNLGTIWGYINAGKETLHWKRIFFLTLLSNAHHLPYIKNIFSWRRFPTCYSKTLQNWSSAVANLSHLSKPQVADFRSLGVNASCPPIKTSKSNKSQHSEEKYTSHIDFSYTDDMFYTSHRQCSLTSAFLPQNTTPSFLTTSVQHGRWKSTPIAQGRLQSQNKKNSRERENRERCFRY